MQQTNNLPAEHLKEETFIPFPVWSPQHSPSVSKKKFHPVCFNVAKGHVKQKFSGEGNLSRILTGKDTLEFNIEIQKRPESLLSKESSTEKRDKYLKLQLGGDAPFHGFRTTVPEIQGVNNDGTVSFVKKLEKNIRKQSGKRFTKSMSTSDLAETKCSDENFNVEKRKIPIIPSKYHIQSKKADIYERLNLFILKKLENMNGTSKKYLESNINIHYDTPVLSEKKDYIPDNILADQQANHMVAVYEERKKNKILKEKAINESRRHSDNFTPKEKTPIILNRYDGDIFANPGTYKVAKAVYDYSAYNKNELSFKKGDILMLNKKLDDNWYKAEICGKQGLVPSTYVEILTEATKHCANVKSGVAKYKFNAQSSVELSLHKGDIVQILRQIDQNWFEGQIGDRKGIFPCSYVYVFDNDYLLKPDETKTQCVTIESAKHSICKVIYSYKPQNEDELELKEGDIVKVLEICDDGWCIGAIEDRFGTFPGNYVQTM